MKKLVCLILAMVMVLSCSVLVFGFEDVVVEHKYTESISYMYEKGFISGYSDGTFRPDNNLSINEYAAVLVRAAEDEDFVLSNEGFWSKSYLNFIYQNKWLSYFDIQRCDYELCKANITREIALKGLFNMMGIDEYVYTQYFYDLDIADLDTCSHIDNQNIVNTACLLGLIEKDEQGNVYPLSYVTRGEICEWVYKLKNMTSEEFEAIVPPVLRNIKIEYIESQGIEKKVENALGEIPVPILEKFAQNGWKLKISSKTLSEIYSFPGLDLSMAVGVCDPNIKTIYVTYDLFSGPSSCLQHEMGHFVDDAFFSDSKSQSEISKLYKAEQDALSTFLRKDYCKSNKGEFFAEAFYAYVAYTTGTSAMNEHLRASLPMICEFFDAFFEELEPKVEEVVETTEIVESMGENIDTVAEVINENITVIS